MKTDEQARTAAPLVARRASDVDVSVLVPAKDESENLPLFMELAAAAFASSPAHPSGWTPGADGILA